MGSKFLIALILIFGSCDEPTSVNKPFPVLKLHDFLPKEMEKQTSSYIHSMENKLGGVKVYLSWEKVEDTFFSHYNVYLEKEGIFELLSEKIPLTNNRILLENLPYEKQLKFAITIVTNSGEESNLSNSNHVFIYPTKGFPTKYANTPLESKSDNFNMIWSLSNRNPLIKSDGEARPFDSISVNLFYFDTELTKSIKMISLFSDYESFLIGDDGDIGEDRNYTVNFDSLLNTINMNEIIEVDPSGHYGSTDYFSRKGSYSFFFQLYKNDSGNMYVFRTETFSLNID